MTAGIIIVTHAVTRTGEVMITGIILIAHTSAKSVTTATSIISGNGITGDRALMFGLEVLMHVPGESRFV